MRGDRASELKLEDRILGGRRLVGGNRHRRAALHPRSSSSCAPARPSGRNRWPDRKIEGTIDYGDGTPVSYVGIAEVRDGKLVHKGLPDDHCHCPHWGYVFKGKMTARYADCDEVYEAGDAFHIPPGHVPVENEPSTEFLWFSPSEELLAGVIDQAPTRGS
jgi:hypothetical protein